MEIRDEIYTDPYTGQTVRRINPLIQLLVRVFNIPEARGRTLAEPAYITRFSPHETTQCLPNLGSQIKDMLRQLGVVKEEREPFEEDWTE